jgi:hypothetical protein
MEITVRIKSVYGRELIYPVCEKAKLFALLCHKRTLDRSDIDRIKALGFLVAVEKETI